MEQNQNRRLSNFELLRIVAIFMIILHHLIVHCFFEQLTDPIYIDYYDNAIFNNPIFYKRLLIPEIISPLGKTANCVFIMISGYFCVERENHINLFKLSKKLLLQVIFATLVLIAISWLVYPHQTIEGRVGVIMSINALNSNWWFVGYYFLISVFGALFLNKKVCSISKDSFRSLLIVIFALFSFSFSGSFLEGITNGLRTISAGLFCYLWGGYIKKYNPLKNLRFITLIICIVGVFILVCFTYYSATIETIDTYLIGDQSSAYVQLHGVNIYYDYNFIPICLSLLIFELFKRINIPNNIVINYIASSCFMVYLLHENAFVRNLWGKSADLVNLLYNSPARFCLMILFLSFLTFFAGFVLYSIYQVLIYLFGKFKPLLFKNNN